MSTRDSSPNIQEVPSTPHVDDTLDEPADNVPSMRKELSELHEKVDDLLRMMRAITAKQSKKRAYNEASSTNETPPAAHVRIKSGATDAPQYVARAKEPSIPLPDAFDGNPKNLKKFLTELDLCFRAAPTKFAGMTLRSSLQGDFVQALRYTLGGTPGCCAGRRSKWDTRCGRTLSTGLSQSSWIIWRGRTQGRSSSALSRPVRSVTLSH